LNLNRDDPVHRSLIGLAFAAAQLVEDLHDYQHYLGGNEDWPFDLSLVERHYGEVTLAWERFQAAMKPDNARQIEKWGAPGTENDQRAQEPRG
jgi:hypothetical protein